jgi:uncharacterized membrane protein YfcA
LKVYTILATGVIASILSGFLYFNFIHPVFLGITAGLFMVANILKCFVRKIKEIKKILKNKIKNKNKLVFKI